MCQGNKSRYGKLNIEAFIRRGNEVHDFAYDYSRIVEYKNNRTHVEIVCPEHGPFFQRPTDHLDNGRGCPKCGKGRLLLGLKKFIMRGNEVHGFAYDYSQISEYKNNRTKVAIICSKHGLFFQRPTDHLSGKGCPICKSSRGELQIGSILSSMDVNYEPQKKFKNCRNKHPLPFDFFVKSHNLLIEYHGTQHYTPNEFFGGEGVFELQVKNDKIKEQFAADNGYELLIIPYWEKDIERILKQKLCKD